MYKPYLLKDVHDASAQNKFNVISTFAGGGGSSTGYRLAGGNILCVNCILCSSTPTWGPLPWVMQILYSRLIKCIKAFKLSLVWENCWFIVPASFFGDNAFPPSAMIAEFFIKLI